MNPPKFDHVEDIADLTFLNQASVVRNLCLRYGFEAIPVSPLLSKVPLYTDAIIYQYCSKRQNENP
ncbi:hypothetical protein BD769DRAFT_1305839, partial [Suillus cothurnatus]